MENLWSLDIAEVKVNTPKEILDEQAYWLGQITKNLITAEVEVDDYALRKGIFDNNFYIVAPTLDNYRYRLFTVEHDMDIYPLKIDLDEKLYQEIGGTNGGTSIEIDNELQFKEILEKVFHAHRTKHIVGVLNSQIRSFYPPEMDFKQNRVETQVVSQSEDNYF